MGSSLRADLAQREPRTAVDALDLTWEFVAFVLTALVFLLIGLVITIGDLAQSAEAISVGVIGVFVGRAVTVYALVGGASRLRPRRSGLVGVPVAWLHILFWSGLRGAIAVGLALSLPDSTADREQIQAIVFGITLFTLLVQGGTTDLLLRRLGVQTAAAT